MSTYNFRLRFNLSDSHRFSSDALELIIFEQDKITLKLKGSGVDVPLNESASAAILGGPYATIEHARNAAEQAKRAVLLWAVEQRVGLDFGDGNQRSNLTEEGVKYFEEIYKRPIRLDKHGVDVYEATENIGFLDINCKGQAGKNIELFLSKFQHEFPLKQQLSEKQLLACEIYASSFFDVSHRSRFITLVTAIEALLKSEKHGEDVQELVGQFIRLAKTSSIDKFITDSICSSLDWIRYESIGSAARKLANNLLSGKLYNGKNAGAFFTAAYSIRSKIVHKGAPDETLDVLEMANLMEEFVADLILASLSINNCDNSNA